MTLSIYHYHHRSGLVLLLIAVLLAIQNCPASGLRYPSASSLSEDDDEHYHVSPLDTGKTYFLKRGDSFFVATQSALNLQNALPLGSYTVGFDGFLQEYFLKPILPFDLEGTKLYGDTVHHGQRILQTFQARTGQSTGVLLAGQKGSGKTLLAKYISVEAAKRGISTIVINEPWSGEGFNTFIQAIQQPAIVLFDEFEKVYRQSMDAELAESNRQRENGYYSHHCDDDGGLGNPSQDAILTLLDGVYPSTMLFVLTVNDKSKITSNMMNRPGRIYYVLDFSGLEPDFIRDCESARE
jgi:ATPase family associated with various cellular activities (AAA)